MACECFERNSFIWLVRPFPWWWHFRPRYNGANTKDTVSHRTELQGAFIAERYYMFERRVLSRERFGLLEGLNETVECLRRTNLLFAPRAVNLWQLKGKHFGCGKEL